jgi:signal peptide peptidase SppA
MLYERIVHYVANELWAITPDKLSEIVSVLAFRASGQAFTPDEIQARIGSRQTPVTATGRDVAVIPIRGTIAHRMGGMAESSGGTSAEGIGRMLAQAAADPNVGTILYDVDSPGGTVTGVPELAAKMRALRGQKRQVALVNGMAGSAAYWLASQADEIVSIPSGMAGSVGVFTAHADMSAKLEKEGVKVTMISAGKHKVEGNPFEPLSDDTRGFIQARVDEAMGWFVADVAAGRGVSVATVREGYGEGRALTAQDALAAGMIDRIEPVDVALARIMGASPAGVRAEIDAPTVADTDAAMRQRLEWA